MDNNVEGYRAKSICSTDLGKLAKSIGNSSFCIFSGNLKPWNPVAEGEHPCTDLWPGEFRTTKNLFVVFSLWGKFKKSFLRIERDILWKMLFRGTHFSRTTKYINLLGIRVKYFLCPTAAGIENTLWMQNYSADAVLHMKMQGIFLPQSA